MSAPETWQAARGMIPAARIPCDSGDISDRHRKAAFPFCPRRLPPGHTSGWQKEAWIHRAGTPLPSACRDTRGSHGASVRGPGYPRRQAITRQRTCCRPGTQNGTPRLPRRPGRKTPAGSGRKNTKPGLVVIRQAQGRREGSLPTRQNSLRLSPVARREAGKA